MLDGAAAVFNAAGRGGYRESWDQPSRYHRDNVEVAAILASACARHSGIRLVQASTSSVLGACAVGDEDSPVKPCSPYGRSKADAEMNLLSGPARDSVVLLRLFSVYGSRQRPEMGIRRAIDSALTGQPLPLYGHGLHMRSFTHVSDVVRAMVLASEHGVPGQIYHIGSDESHSMRHVLEVISGIEGRTVSVSCLPDQRGNQNVTRCRGDKAREHLGFGASIELTEGLAEQYHWQAASLRAEPA